MSHHTIVQLVRAANTLIHRDILLKQLSHDGRAQEYIADFAQRHKAHPELCQMVYCELLQFLIIVACQPHQRHTPSKIVGAMWTDLNRFENRSFYQTCILEHLGLPYVMPDPIPDSMDDKAQRQYQDTVDLYQNLFGTPPTRIWPKRGAAMLETYAADDR